MKASYFNKFGQDTQLEIVMEAGILVANSRRSNLVLRLFQLKNLYVEVQSRAASGEVVQVFAFEDSFFLEPYLEEIDISPLTSLLL